MSTKPTTTIRIDLDVKRRASEVFDEIGIGMSAAINTFLKAVVREGAMPFDINMVRSKANSKFRNATLNRAFIAKKDEFPFGPRPAGWSFAGLPAAPGACSCRRPI